MPSLNLRNALKRDPNRLTLKQRAAALKATAGRVFRRRPVAVAPAGEGADPRLVAMIAELLEARHKLNDPAVPDGPEADALGDRETALSMEVYRFPAQSIHDMAAKLPFLREEAEDAARGWEGRRVPFEESPPGAAWSGLLRDIEHLAGAAPAAEIEPDPILAVIEANREAAGVDWRGGLMPGSAGAFVASDLADQIVRCWREWSLITDGEEPNEDPEVMRALIARRTALIDAADALPAIPENLTAKALAFAWVGYTEKWESDLPRAGYDTDGRLALDVDAAICGRLAMGA